MNRRGLGCAAALGAAIALPAGIYIGSLGTEQEESQGTAGIPGTGDRSRNVYSPRVLDDPHVLDKQRQVVEALELGCRQSRLHCEEARQARTWITEKEARR